MQHQQSNPISQISGERAGQAGGLRGSARGLTKNSCGKLTPGGHRGTKAVSLDG